MGIITQPAYNWGGGGTTLNGFNGNLLMGIITPDICYINLWMGDYNPTYNWGGYHLERF